MKASRIGRSALWLFGMGLACVVGAQEEPNSQQTERKGEVVQSRVDAGYLLQFQSRTGMPDGMDRGRVAETVRERVQKFEQLRAAYLEQHRKMLQELKGASTELDREQIRERIQERRQEWTDLARQIREHARERVTALKERLPNHGELLDQAKEQAREQLREGLETARERSRRGLE
jgi:hypothetical protein